MKSITKLLQYVLMTEETKVETKKHIIIIRTEIFDKQTLLPVSMSDFQKERKEKDKRKERKKLPEKRNVLP
jgi:hypothetical protein